MAKRQSVLAAAAEMAKRPESLESDRLPAMNQNSATGVFAERQTLLNEIATGRRKDVAHRLIEPEKCRMWRRHNRIYDRLNEQNCADLVEQIGENGQKIPAIVRKLKDDPGGYEYEVICGARRHFAVSYLRNAKGRTDVHYLVEVRSLSDEEAFQLSDVENRSRKDISDYERGIDYHTALEEFYDGSVSTMADRIGIARQSLSHYLYLARFPEEVVRAYGDPTQISVRHGTILSPLLNDPKKGVAVREKAKQIAQEQARAESIGSTLAYDGAAVFKLLRDAGQLAAHQRRTTAQKVSVPAENGSELMSIERSKKFIKVRIPRAAAAKKKLIIDALRKHLD